MKRIFAYLLIFSVLILLLTSASALKAECNMLLDENQSVISIWRFEGRGTVELPLPLDVDSYEIEGGLALQSPEGLSIFIGRTNKTAIAFESRLMVEENDNISLLRAFLPVIEAVDVSLHGPKNTEFVSTNPVATLMDSEAGPKAFWSLSNVKQIYVTYQSIENEIEGGEALLEEQETGFSMPEIPSFVWFILAGLLALMILAKFAFFALKITGPWWLSRGMVNVMKSFPDAEQKLIVFLVKNRGRADMKKLKGLALEDANLGAMLESLKGKSVVEITGEGDKKEIRLTKWFRYLQ